MKAGRAGRTWMALTLLLANGCTALRNLPRSEYAAEEERRDVVVGPTDRGGIYLLGMRRPIDVFRGIKWGTGTELATLLRNLDQAGLDYGFFPTRPKIESVEDLVPLRRRLLRQMAPLTYATMQTLGIGQETKEVG